MTRSYTIALDGSTYHGSVAILRDSQVVAERSLGGDDGTPRSGRGETLMPAIAECLREAQIGRDSIARIVCGAGPGSFTSLRVAGSVAKGLAVGYGVDLYAVSSLVLTVAGASPALPAGEYVSILDAMRGEYYVARVTVLPDRTVLQSEPTTLVHEQELAELAERNPLIRAVGPGQVLDFHPHARGVAPLLEGLIERRPVDLAAWEPNYGRLAEAQVRWEAAHGRPLQG